MLNSERLGEGANLQWSDTIDLIVKNNILRHKTIIGRIYV